jgi:PPOX class probable F420-dependent enzyme
MDEKKTKRDLKALVPASHQDLLLDETRAFAYLATNMKDGTPQVTPVWFNTDGDHILINTAAGRVKDKNMRAHPQVALAITDPRNPYRYLQIRGRITEFTTQGSVDHINALSMKYQNEPEYKGFTPGMVRVTFKITPEKVSVMG